MLQKYNIDEDPTDPAPPQLSPLLSLISSLQLDELEKLELDDHLEGETLAFALDIANEDGDAFGGVYLCLYSPVG
jgi:hypothetical protein